MIQLMLHYYTLALKPIKRAGFSCFPVTEIHIHIFTFMVDFFQPETWPVRDAGYIGDCLGSF